MKRMYTLLLIIAVAIIAISAATAIADQVITAPVDQVITKLDKNGNEFTRIMITESRELQGIKYQTQVPIMCFQGTNEAARNLKKGQIIKVVVRPQQYQGSTSYTAIAIVK